MIRKGKRTNATAYLVVAVILSCYLAKMIDCYTLRKADRRKEADATKTIGVQEGRIVFGKGFKKASSLEPQVIDESKPSSNANVEDDTAYQADSAGETKDSSPLGSSWKRMAPSLQCGGEQMKFRAVGPGASRFVVDGNDTPVALSQVPSTCGYTMQRNSLALVMLVPYNGCNMVQEGGYYMLPMRWQGIPVSLWCPKPAAADPTTAATQSTAATESPVSETPRKQPYPPVLQMPYSVKNPYASLPLFFPPYQYPSAVESTMAATTTTTTTKKPEMPAVQQLANFNFNPYFQPVVITPAQTTTTTKPSTAAQPTTTTKKPEMPAVQQLPSFNFHPYFQPPVQQLPNFNFHPYFQPLVKTPVQTTTKASTAAQPTATTTTKKPEMPAVQQLPNFFNFNPYFQPLVQTPVQTTTKSNTAAQPTATTTTKKPEKPAAQQLQNFRPYIVKHPVFFNPWSPQEHLKMTAEPATTIKPTATLPQQQQFAGHMPYLYALLPQTGLNMQGDTSPTTTAPKTDSQLKLVPPYDPSNFHGFNFEKPLTWHFPQISEPYPW